MLKNKKVIISLVVILAIIIAGIVTIVTKGFNYDLYYSANTELKISTEIEDIEKNDIKNIVNSVIKNEETNVQVEDKNIYILAKDITKEQQTELLNQLNEKYTTELTEENLNIETNVGVDFTDIMFQYISPAILVTIIILVYFAIKYRKQNWLKVITIVLAVLILVEALAVSIVAIAGIPLSMYIMPVLLGIYILTILVLTYVFEKNKK